MNMWYFNLPVVFLFSHIHVLIWLQWSLSGGMKDLQLQHVGSSSLTRG